MEKNSINYVLIGLGIVLALLLTFNYNKLKKGFLHIFGGDIDKVEFGGLVFLFMFIWMIYKEGTRDHDWQYFSDTYILFVSGAAVTGLGMNKVIEAFKQMRGVDTTETKIETKITKTNTDTNKDESSEAPK